MSESRVLTVGSEVPNFELDVYNPEHREFGKISLGELKVQKKDTAENRRELAEAKAKAEYEVAKERCDDQKGEQKNACQNQAKANRDRAMAQARGKEDSSRGAGTVKR